MPDEMSAEMPTPQVVDAPEKPETPAPEPDAE